MKNGIGLQLASIVWIVTDNKNNRLQKLIDLLRKKTLQEKISDYFFTELLQLRKHESNDKNCIAFTRSYVHS